MMIAVVLRCRRAPCLAVTAPRPLQSLPSSFYLSFADRMIAKSYRNS
jgi:hypothetical protein